MTVAKQKTTGKEPVAGYDKLKTREVVASLRGCSQVELTRIDGYEQSHLNRVSVFNKLRWLRGNEPMSGYDALSIEQTVAAIQKADLATLKRVRGYERKFRGSPDVLKAVDALHAERRVPLVSRDRS